MKRYQVEVLSIENETTYILQDLANESLAEVAPGIGFNLFRFETFGQHLILPPPSLSYLKDEKEANFKYGIPILFPPNRVKNGTLPYQGKSYQLPLNEPTNHLHGEICARSWDVVEYGSSDNTGAYLTAQFDYRKHQDILAYFPHPLRFTLTYRLYQGSLYLEGSIHNQGRDEAPFAFGLHPYFNVSTDHSQQVEIILPAVEEWPVTQDAFVTGLPQTTSLTERVNEGVPLSEFPAGSCWLFKLNNQHQPCLIRDRQTGSTIKYQVSPVFPYLLLFRPTWASAISFEPYTYVTDAFNLPWPYEITGARGLAADQEFTFRTRLWFESRV